MAGPLRLSSGFPESGARGKRRTYSFSPRLQARGRAGERSSHGQHRLSQRGGTIRLEEHCGRMAILDGLIGQVPFIAAIAGNEPLLALAFLTVTATLVALGVP